MDGSQPVPIQPEFLPFPRFGVLAQYIGASWSIDPIPGPRSEAETLAILEMAAAALRTKLSQEEATTHAPADHSPRGEAG